MEQIQKQYQALCAELGHLTLNKERIEARLKVVRAAIEDLDKRAGEINAASAATTEAASEAEVQP